MVAILSIATIGIAWAQSTPQPGTNSFAHIPQRARITTDELLRNTCAEPIGAGVVIPTRRRKWIYNIPHKNIASQSSLNCFYDKSITWGAKIYAYWAFGFVAENPGEQYTDGGQGIVGILKAINRQKDNQRDFDQETKANETQHQQRIAIEGVLAEKLTQNHPDIRDCMDETTRNSGKALANGSGVRMAKNNIEKIVYEQSLKKNDLEHMTAVFKNRVENGYCSPTDIEVIDEAGTTIPRKTFNCTEIGKMPDADVRVQSLFHPAENFTEPDNLKKPSLTYNLGKPNDEPLEEGHDQQKAAIDLINNLAARYQPPYLPENMENTAQGRAYLTKYKTYQAKVSAAVNALTEIAAMRTANGGSLSPEALKERWTGDNSLQLGGESNEDIYKRIFGDDAQFPETPSEIELMRFDVLRRYVERKDNGWQGLMDSLGKPVVKPDGTTERIPPTNSPPLGGYLSSPVPGHRVSSYFGPRRSPCAGCSTTHKGVDYATPVGTTIQSVGDGVVAAVRAQKDGNGNLKGYGYYIVIRHSNNHSTLYAHLKSLPTLTEGTKVTKGMAIAQTGNTGSSSGPHLHFEFKVSNVAVDPLVALGQNTQQSQDTARATGTEGQETVKASDEAVGDITNQQAELDEYADIELARSLALTNFMLYQYHRQLEIQNSIKATALLNKINPSTRKEMEGYSARANFGAKR